jgi:hypothetical protein
MNENGLRALLAERVAASPAPGSWLGGVQQRVTRIRRRRVAVTAGLAAGLASVLIAAVAAPYAAHRRTPEPAVQPVRTVIGLPPYLNGGKLIAQRQVAPPPYPGTATVTLTVPVTNAAMFWGVNCSGDAGGYKIVSPSISEGGTCGPGVLVGGMYRPRDVGLTPGTAIPVVFTVGLAASQPDGRLAAPVWVGVWASVPEAQYPPLPTGHVRTRDAPPPHGLILNDPEFRADPEKDGLNTTVAVETVLTDASAIEMFCWRTGVLRVTVNGRLFREQTCWNDGGDGGRIVLEYRKGDWPKGLLAGQRIRVAVSAAWFREPGWYFALGTR